MVQGIHLVAPGGVEFFIQRGGVAAIVDTNLLGQLMPCVAGRIISNNEVFNAVLVSLGTHGNYLFHGCRGREPVYFRRNLCSGRLGQREQQHSLGNGRWTAIVIWWT
jgi:hypothetical protein